MKIKLVTRKIDLDVSGIDVLLQYNITFLDDSYIVKVETDRPSGILFVSIVQQKTKDKIRVPFDLTAFPDVRELTVGGIVYTKKYISFPDSGVLTQLTAGKATLNMAATAFLICVSGLTGILSNVIGSVQVMNDTEEEVEETEENEGGEELV